MNRSAASPAAAPRVSGVPLSSGIPRRFKDDPHLVLIRRTASPVAERYRRLRLRLEQGTPEAPVPPQMIVVTSAIPGEGKTTTATNLALAYAEDQERRTLLIDADLRRPAASRFITPEPKFGLSELLAGEATLDHALIEIADSKLWILPSGASREAPIELQQSDMLGSLIADLRRMFDRIVVDAPPTVPFTDAAVLAAHADMALLVVRAGTTTKPLIRRAAESLGGCGTVGVVLNEVEFTVVDRYYYGYDDNKPDRRARSQKQERSA